MGEGPGVRSGFVCGLFCFWPGLFVGLCEGFGGLDGATDGEENAHGVWCDGNFCFGDARGGIGIDNVERGWARGVGDIEPDPFGKFKTEGLAPCVEGDVKSGFARSVGEFDRKRVRTGAPVWRLKDDAVKAHVVESDAIFFGVCKCGLTEGFVSFSHGDEHCRKPHHFVGLRRRTPVYP